MARWDEEVAAVLSGLIGGGRYGIKIRVPHALVMTFLFGNGKTFQEKIRIVMKLALEHASNLAAFAGLYKLMLATLKVMDRRINQNGDIGFLSNPTTISGPGLPDESYHAFVAGAVGGYIVWGRYSSINYQLVLYLASRVIVGCMKLARKKGVPPFAWKSSTFKNTYPWAAAGIWGTVMMLFETCPDTLHPSLRRSMDEIYRFTGVGSVE